MAAVIVLELPDDADLPDDAAVAIEALKAADAWPDDAKAHMAISDSAQRVLNVFDHSQDGF